MKELIEYDTERGLGGKDFAFILYGIYPIKRICKSFYRELSIQITKQMEDIIGVKNLKNIIGLDFNTQFTTYEGEAYLYYDVNYDVEKISTTHYGELRQLHNGGYSYNSIGLSSKATLGAHFWIRWKSLLPEYEYIEPNLEIEVKSGEVKFEICKIVPQNIIIEAYNGNPPNSINFNAWIECIKQGLSLNKKFLANKTGLYFDYEISGGWPDVIMSIYHKETSTLGLSEKMQSILCVFMDEWNDKQEKKKSQKFIHNISLIDLDDESKESNIIQFHVDFANCNINIIKNLMIFINDNLLNIEKIVLS